MISIYDVLKASKGIHVDDTFANLWGRKLSNAYTVATYSGTLPTTLQTVAGYLESYKIYGNTVQSGTPTPENPVMPIGCGELETTGAHAGQYKLPLTVNGVEYPIYLGENQTTRIIKKLVLTGTDADGIWAASTARAGSFYTSIGVNGIIGAALCDRAVNAKTLADYNYGNIYVEKSGISVIINLWLFNAAITLTDFRSYLAAQYANGTPVTIWYVLRDPETGIVNEPLMKIDNYADTVSMEQAGVSIPTFAGTTVIDYNGTPKPDKVELTYKKPKGQ